MSDEIAEWEAQITAAQRRSDVQEFLQVYNLGALLGTVRVQYRQLGGDFYAECSVRRAGLKRPRRLFAAAPGRADALEALAAVVAEYFYPVENA